MILKNQSGPTPHNPKRDCANRTGRAGWYGYYAGFSPNFVRDVLGFVSNDSACKRIIDPWNGSGTTTEVASRLGFEAIGFDLNPVMVIVSKARLLQSNVEPSLRSLVTEILQKADAAKSPFTVDPLDEWLEPGAVAGVRQLEVAIQTLLISRDHYHQLALQASLQCVSSLAAFFYVALFRTLRKILTPFRSSNPTWIKFPESPAQRLKVTRAAIHRLFRKYVEGMASDLIVDEFGSADGKAIPLALLDIASSDSLPLTKESVDLVVSSPPYCTRIDYVIKTAPELALLGVQGKSGLHDLRDKMIGTPTICGTPQEPSNQWGVSCVGLLDRIAHHTAKASKSYYWKTCMQYFEGLFCSLQEIHRVMRPGARCFLVVQDSHYKELHVDLATIVTEMGGSLGWRLQNRFDFAGLRNLVNVNKGARVYAKPKVATETVLSFVATKMNSRRTRKCQTT